MIGRKKKRTCRIGIFAVAHAVYWDQFPGLYESLMHHYGEACEKVRKNDVELVDFGMVDSSEKAFAVAPKMLGADLDLVFCDMVTYATSSVFAPILQALGKIPVVLLALQPRRAMDYGKACTFMQLENDSICAVPEFTCVAQRFGKPVNDVILGTLGSDVQADRQIAEWCDIAKVLRGLRGARLGLMGRVLEAMYDMHADPTAIAATFGIHVPLIEIDDLLQSYSQVTEGEIADLARTAEIYRKYHADVIEDGTLYHLRAPFAGNTMCMQCVSKDKKASLVLFMNKLKEPDIFRFVKLKGLDAKKMYRNTLDNQVHSGEYYARIGLNLSREWLEEFSHRLIVLTEE